ncbi:MAG: hypothetical protein JXA68_05265 [Ignavibacteriales bacterium]|nr:hypothetical protein [Ignavibacteriales bacterium]
MEKSNKLVIFLGLIFFTNLLFAQNFVDAIRLSEPGIGSNARALGMGNAYIALSNDFSGTFFNPAGLGLVRYGELVGSLNYNSFNNKSTLYNNTTNFSNSNTELNQFGLVLPFPVEQGSLVFSFGYNNNKDFNKAVKFDGYNPNDHSMIQDLTSYNDDLAYELAVSYAGISSDETIIHGQLNQSGSMLDKGGITTWTFGTAVEVAPNVYIGGTLDILGGTYKKEKEYYEDDIYNVYDNTTLTDPTLPETADFQTFFLNDVLDWTLSGFDFKLGFLTTVKDLLNLGLVIKFPSNYSIEENYFIDGYADFAATRFILSEPYDVTIEYDIKTPFEFMGGVAFNIMGIAIISGDVSYIDYTQMEFTEGLTPTDISQNNKEIKQYTREVLNLSAGAEVTIPNTSLSIRGGFMYRPSPYFDDPSKYDKKYITAGVGYVAGGSIALDFAFARGWWEDFGDNYSSNLSRNYQTITVNNFTFTLTYMF